MAYYTNNNRNSHLVQKRRRTGSVATQIVNRDDGFELEVKSANYGFGRTRMFVRDPEGDRFVSLSGSGCRAVYRALQKHYQRTGKSW